MAALIASGKKQLIHAENGAPTSSAQACLCALGKGKKAAEPAFGRIIAQRYGVIFWPLAVNDGSMNMVTTKHEDTEQLREVKAILQRLQRISDDAAGDAMAPGYAAPENRGRAELETLLSRSTAIAPAGNTRVAQNGAAAVLEPVALPEPASGAAKPAGAAQQGLAIVKPPAKRLPLPLVAVAAVALILAGGSYFLLPADTFQGTQPAAMPGVAAPAPVQVTPGMLSELDKVRQLLDKGQIAAARKLLAQPQLAATQEGAWLTARSFDPNFLSSVPSPDAGADITIAAGWYLRWHEIATRNGLAMDEARLQRIISAMR